MKSREGYRLLYTCALVCVVLTGAGRLLGIARITAIHILAAVFALMLCIGTQLLKGKGKAVCATLTAVFFAVVIAAAGVEQCGAFLTSWLRWMAGSEGWREEWRVIYEVVQAGMISLLCYLLQFILERFIVMKVITADILISALLFCLLTQWQLSHLSVVFSIAYIVMVYAEWIQREWKKAGSRDRKRYMLWIMPFVALYLILMLLMPAPEQPYEWRFVRGTCSRIRDSLLSLAQNFMRSGEEEFAMTLSGFSEDGELQDEMEENKREVMTLQGKGSLVTNLYLTGKIYDTFDGKSWRQENHDTAVNLFQDTHQIQDAAIRTDRDYLQNYLAAATLQVKYRHLRTASLFVPLKTRQIRMQGENTPYFWDGDNLFFQKRRGYGTEYEVNYYQVNVGAEAFDRLLRAADSVDGDEEQIRKIYEIYSEDIVLSEETERYLDTVTEGAYDRLSWLRLVEQELTAYTYTRQPEKLPDGIEEGGDFLDYFLSEGREGYCTHFATAFALLARSQGMPSRYVQGFCVPMRGVEEVSVYNDMAHAWPEIYFEGVGWIPFEPTPGYDRIRYTPWKTEQDEGEVVIKAKEVSWESEETEEPSAAAAAEETKEENRRRAGRALGVIGYALAAVCAAGCILLLLQQLIERALYRRMDVTGKFRAVVSLNMKILAILGLRREEKETLQEFRERILRGEMCGDCSVQFIADYEEVLYGEKAAAQRMLQTAAAENKELMRELKEKKKWRYFLFCHRKVCSMI